MNDISKCSGEDCPLKEDCKRYKAPCGTWQSWIEPRFEDGKCEHFWKLNK